MDEQSLTAKKEEIAQDIKANKILLYMKGNKMAPMCGFSAQVVHILNDLGSDYETKNILEDEVLRQAIKDFSDWPTLPQLYVNEEFVGGCDIITELYQSGELKELVSK